MCNFVDDNGQGQNERHVLTLFNLDTVLIANGEELLRNRGHQMVFLLDLELSRTIVAFDLECAMFRFDGEFLSTEQIHFTASERETSVDVRDVHIDLYLTSATTLSFWRISYFARPSGLMTCLTRRTRLWDELIDSRVQLTGVEFVLTAWISQLKVFAQCDGFESHLNRHGQSASAAGTIK